MKRIAALVLLGAICALTPFVSAKEDKADKAASKESSKAGAMTEHKMFTPADIKWNDGPPFLPAGAKIAVLDGDPAKAGPFTVRLQMPAGYKIPPHTHPTAEHITVISGGFHLGTGDKMDEGGSHDMVAGSFAVMPAGTKHFAWASDETVVQVHGTGPFAIKYVNSVDDPRGATK